MGCNRSGFNILLGRVLKATVGIFFYMERFLLNFMEELIGFVKTVFAEITIQGNVC